MTRLSVLVAFSCLLLNVKTVMSACPSSTVQVDAFDSLTSTFTSEGYPYGYPSLQECTWLVTATGGQRVLLFVPYLYLERNYDLLYVFDGNSTSDPVLWVGTGLKRDKFLISSSGTMYIRFLSDYSAERAGFKIQTIGVNRDTSAVSYNCGDTLTAFTNQSQLSVVYAYDTHLADYCDFTITSSIGTNIQFSAQIKNGKLSVYDGTSAASGLLFRYATTDNTNTYQSSGNSIYIEMTSDFTDFLLVYEQVGTAATVPTTASTTTTIAPEYTCSTSYVEAMSSADILESPGYPDTYSNNLYCTTRIEAMDPAESVHVTIIDIDLPSCCDQLTIYDGYDESYPMIWNSSAYSSLVVNSTGRALAIAFYTDSIGTLRGFQLEYIQISRAIPACIPYNTTILTATTSKQWITSPNHPSNYDNNDVVYWLITKSSESANIAIDIEDINIEFSTDCIYDRLTFYDGACVSAPILAEVCGSNDAAIEDSNGLYILVEFVTDYSVTSSGFKLSYVMGQYEGSTEEGGEDEGSWPWWVLIYTIPAVGVLIFVIFRVFYVRHKRKKLVTPTPTKGKNNLLVSPPPVMTSTYPKRLTTHQLLTELQSRYGSKEAKVKVSRKHKEMYGVNNGGSSPHPPPNIISSPYGGDTGDSAYPPNFFVIADNEMNFDRMSKMAPNPEMVAGSTLPAVKAHSVLMETQSIPAPAKYITPGEERNAGVPTSSRGLFMQAKT